MVLINIWYFYDGREGIPWQNHESLNLMISDFNDTFRNCYLCFRARQYLRSLAPVMKSVALQLRRAETDWSGCCHMAVQGALWFAKRLSLNLNFSFLNRISLLLISSSYPLVLTRLGGTRSRPYTSRKIEPGTSWMAVTRVNHYTKHAVP